MNSTMNSNFTNEAQILEKNEFNIPNNYVTAFLLSLLWTLGQ